MRVEELRRQLGDLAQSSPSPRSDPLPAVLDRHRRHRRRRVVALGGGTSIFVAVVAFALIQLTGSPASRRISAGPGPSTPALDPRGAAARLARQLLAQAIVPPGARAMDKSPLDLLAQPGSTPASPNLIDVARLWAVAMTPDGVLAFLRAHPVPGLSLNSSGHIGQRGDGAQLISEELASPGHDISVAQLLFAVAPLDSGRSELRVDAQVVWRPVRPVAEYAEPSFHAVQLTRRQISFLSGATTDQRQRTITDPATVNQLAAMFDSLLTEVPGVRSCGQFPTLRQGYTVDYDVAFTTAAETPLRLVATIAGCGGISVTANGQREPTLDDTREFSSTVAQLLGDSSPLAQ